MEVINISILTEYNEAETMEAIKNEAYKEAYKEGYDKGTVKAIKGIMECTKQTFDDVCVILNVSEQDKVKYAKML